MHNYKIIDNFLEPERYIAIKNKLHSLDFPWFWSDKQTTAEGKDPDSGFFFHPFYSNNRATSPQIAILDPIFEKLEANILINARANVVIKTHDGWSNIHTDNYTKDMIHKTAIMYFSSNNGKTILLIDGEKVEVETVDNRVVIFDSKIEHYLVHQTDEMRRTVLNINYIT